MLVDGVPGFFLPPTLPMADPYRFKVVVVGDAFMGKSSLLHRLRFKAMPRGGYVNTIGCEFFSHTVETDSGARATLCLWDTAGHETFRSFTPSFLRNAQACLACVDLSSHDASAAGENLRWWAEEARRHVADVSLVVVGTKADLPRGSLLEGGLGDLAASLAAVFAAETSALTGEGVEALFRDVAAHLLAKHPTRPQHEAAVALRPREEACRCPCQP